MQQLSFLVPGFSKCGTTTLCSLLNQHPDIYIPQQKEPNFFCRDDYAQHWQEYRNLFNDSAAATVLGEGSTFYASGDLEQLSRQRIKMLYPDIKLIFIARDPINRIESSLREFHHSGPRYGFDTPFDPEQALRQFPAIISDTRYWSRLGNYKDHLPEQNIHILLLEDLQSQTRLELEKCFSFLGVDASIEVPGLSRQLNAGSSKLYDSKLLRTLRNNRITGPTLSKISIDTQDRVFSKLGLRRHFNRAINWKPDTRLWLLAQLQSEIDTFLAHCGKPANYWPRYYQLVHSSPEQQRQE